MPGFDLHPIHAEKENEQTARRNARYGLLLFGLYLLLYGTFVCLNAFTPNVMGATPFAGINLAIWYGVGLITAAFILALFYAWLCRTK